MVVRRDRRDLDERGYAPLVDTERLPRRTAVAIQGEPGRFFPTDPVVATGLGAATEPAAGVAEAAVMTRAVATSIWARAWACAIYVKGSTCSVSYLVSKWLTSTAGFRSSMRRLRY